MRNYIRTDLIIKARRPAMLRGKSSGLCREFVLTMRNYISTVLIIKARPFNAKEPGFGALPSLHRFYHS